MKRIASEEPAAFAGAGGVIAYAADVMTPEPICLTADMTIRSMARVFREHEISGCPVVDTQGVLIGIVTKTDLINRCLEPMSDEAPGFFFQEMAEQLGDEVEIEPEAEVRVEDIMTQDVITVGVGEDVRGIARRMSGAHVHRVVVVDPAGVPIGIITSMDLLKLIVR